MSDPAREFEPGALIWLSCPDTVWRPALVAGAGGAVRKAVSHVEGTIKIELLASTDADAAVEETVNVPCIGDAKNLPRFLRRNAALVGDGALKYDDLTDVPELHAAAVLHALHIRFRHGQIYTLTGPVLIALNPFRMLPGLYGPKVLNSFIKGSVSPTEKLQPHVFGIASRAFQRVREYHESQTILVSGESGAGKTETTKYVMQFLALAGAEAVDGGAGRMSRVERQVLVSNPLLEAFGNAKTTRNDNSSRFGKYIELQFRSPNAEPEVLGAPLRLAGARVRTYLLEKVRVIKQQEGERSYHIFYQAIAAAHSPARVAGFGDEERDVDLTAFAGHHIESFSYLRGTECNTPKGLDEAEEFEATIDAMRGVGIGAGDVSDILRALGAVLHLGNVDFTAPNDESSQVAEAEDFVDPAEVAATLLGVSRSQLQEALCFRTMQTREGVIRKPQPKLRAADARDSLARHIFHTIFCLVVARTNTSIGTQEGAPFCGVLDIFGFEFFKINSFEQLCINFTNELLQQYFNSFVFENETILYREEGIAWKAEDFPDNAAIVTLLQEKPAGIFPMLDDECFGVGGSSEKWCQKMIRHHEKHPNFDFVKQRQGEFIVQHFAGPVTYLAEGFFEKNRDELSPDLLQCLMSSNKLFVRECLVEPPPEPVSMPASPSGKFGSPDKRAPSSNGSPQKESPDKKASRRVSVSSEFRQQLQELMRQIRSTSPHFIRCIKPNSKKKPFVDDSVLEPEPLLERQSVTEQLAYQGVLEAIRVARAGYPVRFLHRDFLVDFRCLAGPELRPRLEAMLRGGVASSNESCAAGVRELLGSQEVALLLAAVDSKRSASQGGLAGVEVGKTRIFMKQEPFSGLKAAQVELRRAAVTKIQAVQRGHAALTTFRRVLRALVRFQSHVRGVSARGESWRRRYDMAAVKIQAHCCTLLMQERMSRAKLANKASQRWARMRPVRRRFLEVKALLMRVQRWWRGMIKRRRWRNLKVNMLKVQRAWRGHMGRRAALEMRARRHCVQRTVRILLRIRRRNINYLAWRGELMAKYRAPKTKVSPSTNVLIQNLLQCRNEFDRQRSELAQLRSDNVRYEGQLEEVGTRAYTSLRGFFGSR